MFRKESFEVLVDLPGLTLVRVNGELKADVVPGFRTDEEARAILSEFGDVEWGSDDKGEERGR